MVFSSNNAFLKEVMDKKNNIAKTNEKRNSEIRSGLIKRNFRIFKEGCISMTINYLV